MENASKALLISGGILIAMLVISIGVYLFANSADLGSSYEQTMQATEIQKFNVNFTKFEGRKDITIHEIITLANFAKQYEEKEEKHVKISIPGKPDLVNWLNSFATQELESQKTIEELLKNNLNKKFKCLNVIDENEDGRIDVISFINT